MLAEQDKRIQGLDTDVCDLRTKMNESEETTGQEISKIKRDISTELEEQKTNVQEVRRLLSLNFRVDSFR